MCLHFFIAHMQCMSKQTRELPVFRVHVCGNRERCTTTGSYCVFNWEVSRKETGGCRL